MPRRIFLEIGSKYGYWTVLEGAGKNKHRSYLYKVQCKCGTISEVRNTELVAGKTTKCRKCADTIRAIKQRIKLEIGSKYGDWTVLEEAGKNKHGAYFYKVQCTCGTISKASYSNLIRRKTTKCKRCAKSIHGYTNNSLYHIYRGIIARCTNPKSKSYISYGMRGIKVYPTWENSIKDFIDYIEQNLGPRPSPNHELDRINNDGNYEPGNLRWATRQENTNNRSVSKTNRKPNQKFMLVPVEYVKKSYFKDCPYRIEPLYEGQLKIG